MCKNKTWFGFSQKELIDTFAPQIGLNGLYHYTTIDALINGIIGTSNIHDEEVCFWATHCKYLNDPEELKQGAELVKAVCENLNDKFTIEYSNGQSIFTNIEQYEKRCAEAYMISLSENADSLPMWSMYGNNGHGIAIELSTPIAPQDRNDIMVKCQYKESIVMRMITEWLNKDPKLACIAISLLPFIWKNHAYEYENEFRFVTFPNRDSIKYRCKNGIVIPYLEVRFSKELIKSITIGPSANKELVKESLCKFLSQNKMSHIEIKQSKVPYRVI